MTLGPPVALRETMRVQGGRVPLLARHLARLAAGECPAGLIDSAAEAVRSAAAEWGEPYGRMTLTVAPGGEFTIATSARTSSIDVPGGPVIALVESDEPSLPPGAAKPADRSFWDVRLAAAHAQGADVAVLVSRDGRLIDGSQAAVWLVRDGELLTPPSPPALASVSRGVVSDLAPGLSLAARASELTPGDLDSAGEVFLTTAVAGVRAARGRGGPVTDVVASAFDALFTGEGL